MKVPGRIPIAVWLAAVVLAVALVSHAFDQPHDLTLVTILISCCLLGVDWLMSPRSGK